MRQLENLDEVREHSPHFNERKLVTLLAPSSDLSLEEMQQIAELNAGAIPVSQRGKNTIFDNPRDDISIGDLELSTVTGARAKIIIIIIAGDSIVIVVIVIDDTGPSSGKSRSACKMMGV